MRAGKSVRAFSLIEVVIAVALFASTVTVILALLPGLSRQGTETADRLAAQRLPDAIKLELTRLAAHGFDALAAQIPVMNTPLADGLPLVATRNGAGIAGRDAAPTTVAEEERFYGIECWRFPAPPLGYEAGDQTLVLLVRVSWPYPAAVTEASAEFTFVTSINR